MENYQNVKTVRLNVLVDKTKLERFKKIAKKRIHLLLNRLEYL